MSYNDEYAGWLVLDLETMAAPSVAEYLDPVKAPANYKDPAKIAAYVQESTAKQIADAGLEPDLCEVVAVGFQSESSVCPTVLTRADCDEDGLLASLWAVIRNRRLIGFNTLGFDLPVLMRRSQLLNIEGQELNLDRYRTPHLDILERLSFHGRLTYRSLAFYCRRFGIPCADQAAGADIAQFVAAQDWPAVKAHCQSDIEKTTALAARLGWLKIGASV